MKITRIRFIPFSKPAILFLYSLLLLTVFLSPSSPESKELKPYSLQSLKQAISKIVNSGVFTNSRYGIFIKSLKNNEIIFDDNSKAFLIPASNMKILTTASALSTLGAEYRFKTEIFCDSKPSKGIIEKNLYIKGSGNPELYPENMWTIANEIKLLGINEIRGDIIVDDSYLAKELSGHSLPTQTQGTLLSGLSFNYNSVKYSISPFGDKIPFISIHPGSPFFSTSNKMTFAPSSRGNNFRVDVSEEKELTEKITFTGSFNGRYVTSDYTKIKRPALFAGETLKEMLMSSGMKVAGKVREGVIPEKPFPLYTHESKPLSLITEDMNKFSNNFIADHLFLSGGTMNYGLPATLDNAVKAETEYLRENGILSNGVVIKDGSGLSKENRISPLIVSSILEKAWSDFDYGPSLISSLPIMGTDGTLKKRLSNSPVKRNIRAKTGYVNKTSSLSGYIMTKENEPIVFSIIINDCNDIIAARLAQDKIVEMTSLLKRD